MALFNFRNKDDMAVAFIDEFVTQSHNIRQNYEPTWLENWSNYRVEPLLANTSDFAKRYPYHIDTRMSSINLLKTPESHQGVNTLRGVLLASLYGVRDYVEADPVGDEDVEAAKKVSALTMFGLERPGNFRTEWDTLGDSLIYGTGLGKAFWNSVSRLVPRRVPVIDPASGQPVADPDTGQPMTILQNVETLIEDDPALRPLSLYDVWLDPAADRVEDMEGYVERLRINTHNLKRLARTPTWDASGIDAVLDTPPSGKKPVGPGDDDPKLLTEQLNEEDIQAVAKYGVYGAWRYTGMLDEDTARGLDLDPRASATVTHVNGIVIQAAQNPQRNGDLDLFSTTILPTGRGIYGLAPLTVVRYLQDVSDTQLILTVQAMIEAVYQNYLIGGGADAEPNLKRALEQRKPREIFMLEGEVEQVSPLPKDYTGLSIASQSLQLLSQTMRDAMSARDPIRGTISQGDTTATEVQTTAAAALQNVDQLARLIEREELPRRGRLVNDLYYINLDDEGKVFRRVGDDAVTRTGFFDIDSVSDIHFIGARNALSKASKANQLRDFAQLVLSNPLLASSLDWHQFASRYGDEALDIRGLERLFITDENEILARMQALGLARQGPGGLQVPTGPNNASGAQGPTAAPAQSAGEPS